MLDLGPYLRLLLAAAFLVFTVVSGLSVYTFLALPLGTHWRGRAVWYFGAVLVAGSILTVAGTLLTHIVQTVGL